MYCPNCKTEVTATNGYCSRCGTCASSRLCPSGHVMDPSWTECQHCSPARTGQSSNPGAQPGSKGRTFVESTPYSPQPGGFTSGAGLLKDSGSKRKRDTIVEDPFPRSDPRLEQHGAGKAKTIFDPGAGSTPNQVPKQLHSRGNPKLVGWLVSFSHDPSGVDYRIREGRNIIGKDAEKCDIVINGDSTISETHAVVMFRGDQFQIRDNDSTNGTYVDGKDIFGAGAIVLNTGAKLRLGDTELVLYAI